MPNSLIDELQLDASSPLVPVASLLRKALMVANKLELSDIPEWINKELSGYRNGDTVPDYRVIHGEVKAKNPFHGWIPAHFSSNAHQEMVSKKLISQSVAEIEALVKSDGKFALGFSPEAHQILQDLFQEDMEFFCFIQKSRLEGILDEIRNQVLRWAITLDQAGIRGDGLSFTGAEKATAQHMIFHADGGSLTIGVVGNVAGQGSVATGHHPRAGSTTLDDLAALIVEITKNVGALNLSAADAQEVRTALAELNKTKPNEHRKIRQILGRVLGVVGRVGETIISVGTRTYIEGWMKHGL